MRDRVKTGEYNIIGKFMLLAVLFLVMGYFGATYVYASQVTLPSQYYFVFNGQRKEAGTEYEMKAGEILLNITSGTWEPTTEVQWVSSEPGVVKIEQTPSYGSSFCKLVRTGPGYSTLTAIVKQGGNQFSISCVIKVDLLFDQTKMGLTQATTTNERILIMNTIGETKQAYLKYVDYTDVGGNNVSGGSIASTAVLWESDNENIVTVDSNGKLTAVGAGTANITVTSSTASASDKTLKKTLTVVVKPTFTLTLQDNSGNDIVYPSAAKPNVAVAVENVPSSFVLESNAVQGTNLKWEVYDYSTGKKISPTDKSKLTYAVSELSGNVVFTGVKAGTYEIYAFANDDYTANTNAPYAYMKVIVPIRVEDTLVVMNVGDTYNIVDNSNIPNVGVFEYYYDSGNSNIARIDKKTGIVTARSKGTVVIRMVYKTSNNLYDNGAVIVNDIYVTIKVIDGISLNMTTAKMYTSATLMLEATVTDPLMSITWSSSDEKIATVEDGLVTAKKAGIVTITASQTINGVVKSATCEITVQQSVASITVTPGTVGLNIGEYKTLYAEIKPNNLSGVSLEWRSSNESVVKIEQSERLSATIVGVAGGTAVISAINQDNVVVGYCHVTVQQPVTSITLSETDITVDLNTKRLQLRATASPENAVNKNILWSTTNSKVATVDANGLVTVKGSGSVTIIATSEDNPSVTAMCNIVVSIPVTTIALDETTKTMYSGETARLSYTLLPTTASNTGVTWTSTNASVVSVDQTGKVTAKGVGTAVIILKSVDGNHAAYCTVTVKKVATGVKLNTTSLTLKAGEYYYLEAELSPNDSTDTELTWESSDTKVAIVDEKGKIIAKSAGTAIIMVKTQAGGTAYCNLTVTQPVDGLLLNFSEKVIFIDDKFELKVSVSPSAATNLAVTWTSTNPKVATVDKDGTVKGLLGGVTIIECKTVDGGYSAYCVVEVVEPVTSITLNKESYKLGIGKKVTLVATVTRESATYKEVFWYSSDPSVATVNQKGKVTGLKKGYATITAVALDGSEVEASCEIRVVKLVTSVTLNETYLNLLVGEIYNLKTSIKPSSATYKSAKWSSSNDAVAMVDSDGVVTALKAGEALITAAAKDSSGKKAICYVIVRDRVASTGISVQDKRITLVPGETKIVEVAITPASSTDGWSFSTDNAAVAKVDKRTGKITAIATGTANINVMTDSGKTATIEVTVIGLNRTSITLEQYTTYTNALYVEGATTAIKWEIKNPNVAVVTNGTISTRAVGETTITATVNGRKLTCKLKVTKIK